MTNARSPSTVATADPDQLVADDRGHGGLVRPDGGDQVGQAEGGRLAARGRVVPQPDGGIEVVGVEVADPPGRHRLSVPVAAAGVVPAQSRGDRPTTDPMTELPAPDFSVKPTLTGERVLLRPFTLDADAPALPRDAPGRRGAQADRQQPRPR